MKIRTNKDLRRIYKMKVDNRMRQYGDTTFSDNPKKRVIRVNKKASKKYKRTPKYPEVLDTILHEVRHAKHPKEHEKTVKKKVKEQIKNLNRLQKQRTYNLFK